MYVLNNLFHLRLNRNIALSVDSLTSGVHSTRRKELSANRQQSV